MRIKRSFWGALGAAALVVGTASAAMTVKTRARLREGPSATSHLLGDLDPGTAVEVLGDSEGWKRVQTPDGREGFVWGEHLMVEAASDTGGDGAHRDAAAATAAPAPRALADEVRDLRADVGALRQRPDPATAADLERVRDELDRLATAERDLARRFDERGVPGAPPLDPPAESTLLPGMLVFLGGAFMGWAASRFTQRRRDRRQRHRLRF